MSSDKYILQEVVDARTEREFLDLPRKIYKGNRNWVCPLDPSIQAVFDPKKNEMFSDGEAIRWIARDKKGEVVGRIAAFYDREHAFLEEQPTGGCGFSRLSTTRSWPISFSMQPACGFPAGVWRRWTVRSISVPGIPGGGCWSAGTNFSPSMRTRTIRLIIKSCSKITDSRTTSTSIPICVGLEVGQLSDSVYERVKRLEESPGYCFKHISKKNLEQVAEDFRLVYNKAWALFSGVKAMDREQAFRIMNTLRLIIDERLIYFAYYNDEPIGFFIMVPDLNRVIGSFNGKFGWWNKLRLMWALKVAHKADRIFGLIFGVTPEFHGKGIEAGIIRAFEKEVPKLPYKSLELAWIGDFNPVMMRMVESYVCATKHKMHTTYRYLFDRTKEFHRCPRMGVKRRE